MPRAPPPPRLPARLRRLEVFPVRTIPVGLTAPLLLASTVVAAPEPWTPPVLEFSLRTAFTDGVRLRFENPDDVRCFAAAVRKFASACQTLDRGQPPPPPASTAPRFRSRRPAASPLSFGF